MSRLCEPMHSERPCPAAGVGFHPLDDGGVLFDARGQTLYRLNATGGFIWCCLEEGTSVQEVIAALGEAFAMPAVQAQGFVQDIVERWREAGLVDAPSTARPVEAAPSSVPLAPPNVASGRCTDRGDSSTYRLLGTAFSVLYASAEQRCSVDPVLAHLRCGPEALGEVVEVDLLERAGRHGLIVDGTHRFSCDGVAALAPEVKAEILAEAINRSSCLLGLHAGMVCAERGCVLLPGRAGCGKSTLTAALTAAGYGYLSDEAVLLHGDPIMVRPAPVGLCIKEDGWDLLAPFLPELTSADPHHRADGRVVRYVYPRSATLSGDADRCHAVRWIVFPRYAPDGETALRAVSKTETLRRLLDDCLVIPRPLDHDGVARLIRWISDIECLDLPNASLGDAVELLRRRCGVPPEMPDC